VYGGRGGVREVKVKADSRCGGHIHLCRTYQEPLVCLGGTQSSVLSTWNLVGHGGWRRFRKEKSATQKG
jgi:hypothetical protein